VSTKDELHNLMDNKVKNITRGKIESGKGIESLAADKDGNLRFVSSRQFLFKYT